MQMHLVFRPPVAQQSKKRDAVMLPLKHTVLIAVVNVNPVAINDRCRILLTLPFHHTLVHSLVTI